MHSIFSDDELRILSYARYFGLTVANPIIDGLADGGAQSILSVGRTVAEKACPQDMHHELTAQDKVELDALLANKALKAAVTYAQILISEMGSLSMDDFIKVVGKAHHKYLEEL